MKAIKNFNAFKKSLLSATNGNMVESFDSSNQFGGCEYQSYRVYVDDVHYYNMFVIYNFATNTYDVSLETSTCAVSTMTRVCKTQKAMIDSVVRWCYYSYLNTKEISVDSAEYTDRCTESEQQTSEEAIKDTVIADDTIAYQNARVKETKPTVLNVMQCMMCPADREGNRCCGEQWCKQTWKRYGAIVNPEWHHVSLATLANIDNDMLDEKRRHYMKVYRMTANVINTIYKCNKLSSIDKLRTNLIQTVRTMAKNEKIEWALVQYVKAKIDNCYLVNGLQSSFYSKTYVYNKSRSYTKTFFI